MDGFLVIDKPEGITSATVVGIVQRTLKPFLGKVKIGHAGTLDPLATGVLPLAIGHATRTLSYLVDQQKSYRFSVQWGEKRTTGDRAGDIVETNTNRPSEKDILEILPKFIGKIYQTPPAFSALKINGNRAYNLARQKKDVIMPSRQVTIDDLRLISMDGRERACFEVVCGKGTYVRSLAEDIAQHLKTVGYVLELRRLTVGCFKEQDAVALKDFKSIQEVSSVRIFSISDVLDDIPAFTIGTPSEEHRWGTGQPITIPGGSEWDQDQVVLCMDNQGRALGIGCYDRSGILNPQKVFHYLTKEKN